MDLEYYSKYVKYKNKYMKLRFVMSGGKKGHILLPVLTPDITKSYAKFVTISQFKNEYDSQTIPDHGSQKTTITVGTSMLELYTIDDYTKDFIIHNKNNDQNITLIVTMLDEKQRVGNFSLIDEETVHTVNIHGTIHFFEQDNVVWCYCGSLVITIDATIKTLPKQTLKMSLGGLFDLFTANKQLPETTYNEIFDSILRNATSQTERKITNIVKYGLIYNLFEYGSHNNIFRYKNLMDLIVKSEIDNIRTNFAQYKISANFIEQTIQDIREIPSTFPSTYFKIKNSKGDFINTNSTQFIVDTGNTNVTKLSEEFVRLHDLPTFSGCSKIGLVTVNGKVSMCPKFAIMTIKFVDNSIFDPSKEITIVAMVTKQNINIFGQADMLHLMFQSGYRIGKNPNINITTFCKSFEEAYITMQSLNRYVSNFVFDTTHVSSISFQEGYVSHFLDFIAKYGNIQDLICVESLNFLTFVMGYKKISTILRVIGDYMSKNSIVPHKQYETISQLNGTQITLSFIMNEQDMVKLAQFVSETQ